MITGTRARVLVRHLRRSLQHRSRREEREQPGGAFQEKGSEGLNGVQVVSMERRGTVKESWQRSSCQVSASGEWGRQEPREVLKPREGQGSRR